MNLSFVHCPSVLSIGFLALLLSSFDYAFLAAETPSDSQGLRVTVDPATGDYSIGQLGSASDVLQASVAAMVDGRWLRARDYPKQPGAFSAASESPAGISSRCLKKPTLLLNTSSLIQRYRKLAIRFSSSERLPSSSTT